MVINPQHPVTQFLLENQTKLMCILLKKLGLDSVTLTVPDIQATFAERPEDTLTLICHAHNDAIELKLMTLAQAKHYVALADGPVGCNG